MYQSSLSIFNGVELYDNEFNLVITLKFEVYNFTDTLVYIHIYIYTVDTLNIYVE